jgi:hypothetical protein
VKIGLFFSSPSTRSHDSKPLIEISLLQGCDIMPEDISSNAVGNSVNLTLEFTYVCAKSDPSNGAGREMEPQIVLVPTVCGPKHQLTVNSTQTRILEMSSRRDSDDTRLEQLLQKSGEIDKKPSLALRSKERRQDPQHSKNTYMPAIHFSRNHFVSKQTRALVHRAPSPVEALGGIFTINIKP